MEEKIKELGLSPVSNEEFEKQIKSLQTQLTQKDLENARLRFERGTERLETQDYEGAIEDLEGALRILPEGTGAWASTHFNLGIALIKFPRGNRESNLKRAIESYKKILSFPTVEKTTERYASTQNNLGAAYWGLSEVRDKESNLGLAIKAFNEALRVYTFDRFPQDYATTQNNLGTAYGDLSGVRDKEANLGRAITAYNEALRVYTFDRFPQGYATTQNNLGTAYRGLSGVRDKEANLGRAITAY
ncbi:MAG: tetratricopeptide repeat protein, partial [Candidatus Brocadiaceae bacterium]|nr:tetratricopeptide repeat protein [Candidatus Brocadiaceae bacterium]